MSPHPRRRLPERAPASITVVSETTSVLGADEIEEQLERCRRDLNGCCYRMLGSPFEAELGGHGNAQLTFFLDTKRLFPRFALTPRLDA